MLEDPGNREALVGANVSCCIPAAHFSTVDRYALAARVRI